MARQTIIDLDCELIHETDKAYLLDFGLPKQDAIWIPKSVAELSEQNSDGLYTVTLPIKYAEDKELI